MKFQMFAPDDVPCSSRAAPIPCAWNARPIGLKILQNSFRVCHAAMLKQHNARHRLKPMTPMHRVLSRVESNERQTVEAFTAVNDRLSVLGRQITQAVKPQLDQA